MCTENVNGNKRFAGQFCLEGKGQAMVQGDGA
jgi:hypothetical protein